MTKTHSLIIGVSIVVGCLILSTQHTTPVAGQAPPHNTQGRFQMMAVQVAPSNCQVVLTDSITGETWTCQNLHINKTPWIALGSPVKQ